MTVGDGQMQHDIEDLPAAWLQVGRLMEVRFDRLEGDVAELKSDVRVLKTDVAELKTDVVELKSDVRVLKTDVAELKTDVAELKTELRSHQLATENRFNRVDAQLERLIGLVVRDETRKPPSKPKKRT